MKYKANCTFSSMNIEYIKGNVYELDEKTASGFGEDVSPIKKQAEAKAAKPKAEEKKPETKKDEAEDTGKPVEKAEDKQVKKATRK